MRSLAFPLFIAACAPATDAPTDVSGELDRTMGCGDVELVLMDDAGTSALYVVGSGVVAQAHELADVVQYTFPLPHPDLSVSWITGSALEALACGDGAIVDDEWPALSGFISLNVTPQSQHDKSASDARIDVIVDDLVLQGSPDEQAAIPALDVDVLVRASFR